MSDGNSAVAGDRDTRRYVPTQLVIDPGSLKRAAVAKTADFSLLTAAFGGERVTFEPWVSLRLVERDKIVSWGVYQPAFPPGEPEEGDPVLPDVAWRRAEWDKFRDRERLRAAPDKAAYLLGGAQIDSRIRFARLAERPRLEIALRESIELLASGVRIVGMRREDVAWQNLRVCVLADELVLNLDYSPWMARSGEIESWAERWSTLVDSLDDIGTTAPDSDITVSYPPSYEELVAEVRRFPQPDVDPWLTGEE